MSTKIQSDLIFQSGIHHQNEFLLNTYSISAIIYVNTECLKEQDVAMERINYFISGCLENSVFINKGQTEPIKKYMQANIKVCTLPGEPYDQIISHAILLKLNAITEGRFVITELVLSSKIGSGIKFFANVENVYDGFSTFNGWWVNSNTGIADLDKIYKKEKIVQLQKPAEWDNDLLWEAPVPKHITEEILFTDYLEKSQFN